MNAFKPFASQRDREAPDRAIQTTGGFPNDAGSSAQFDVEAAIRSLTPQQSRVFACLAEGLPNKVIARMLGIAEPTVKSHVSVILDKLQCANRIQVALIAQRHRQA